MLPVIKLDGRQAVLLSYLGNDLLGLCNEPSLSCFVPVIKLDGTQAVRTPHLSGQ